ncbi:MAG: sulfatase-like hydrolase/transferase [Planctomycetota bacterium]
MRWLTSLGLFVSLAFTVTAAPRRPNIVMLLSDDLGYGDLGCYGGPVRTPVLDRLADRGMRFDQFYSGCAVCSPSRATLLTGRHHIRTGVYSWIHNDSQRSHLLTREQTLAEVLRDAGYATAHIGKWHLGLPTPQRDKPTPADHGFDYWFATDNNAIPSHRDPTNFIRNGQEVGKIQGYSCQIVVDEAIRWLQQSQGTARPFFLNLWFHEPHQRVAAPADLVSVYGEPNELTAVYSATIQNTDQAIGRLIATLDELNVTDDTLIIYSSDNGTYQASRTGGLRGRKGTNWEGGIRVPGIFVWPDAIPAGTVSHVPSGLVDVLPTVAGLLELDTSSGPPLDGVNLSEVLTRVGDDFRRPQPLFWHLQKSRPIVAMRDRQYFIVGQPDYELSTNNMFQETWIPLIRSGGYRDFQLFDVVTDPQQSNDLAEQMPDVLSRLRVKLLEINASVMADGHDWSLQ